MSFKKLQLIKPIYRAIAEKNYTSPTPIQEATIPVVIEGRDLIASAQTGTGKTAAFALPILQRLFHKQETPKKGKKIRALIVSPTRELAVQIEENFQSYSTYTTLTSTVIFGGTSIDPQKEILRKGIDILIATPGRLLDLHKQDMINLNFVETLVLDEADLMLDMGFIDDVLKINRLCPENKQLLLFSATMPGKVIELANSILKDPVRIQIAATSSAAKSIDQALFYVPKQSKIELCLHLLRHQYTGSILIFRRTKHGVDKLENTLLKNDFNVASLHGDKTQSERQNALNKFKNNEVSILIATDVAARGIDIKNLDTVINFDIPNIPETYVHRIGRTGRAGENGNSISFCAAEEKRYIATIQKLLQKAIPVVMEHPYQLDPEAQPEVHRKKGSKYRKGRKSEGSKKNKKRWY